MAARRYGAYDIVRRLGVGGMAETFLALRHGPGGFEQRVCLKRVLPAYEADPEFVRLFMQEAAIAASLRHGNIVGVIDFGEADGTHFMALELVEGTDLRALAGRLPRRRLPVELASLIAVDLAHALEHAHGHRVVHRDISPSNVLVSLAGEVKLTDFGVAKAMRTAPVTASANIKGKVPYMAPEQAAGQTVDGRADLFSLGVLLYEIISGQRPFEHENQLVTLRLATEGNYRPLAEVAPWAAAPWRGVLDRLLAADPGDRFGSASELIDALSQLAPAVTARRELGACVRRNNPPHTTRVARGPAGTLVATAAPRPAPWTVGEAGPDAETRTRGPLDEALRRDILELGEAGTMPLGPATLDSHAASSLAPHARSASDGRGVRSLHDVTTAALERPLATTVTARRRALVTWTGLSLLAVMGLFAAAQFGASGGPSARNPESPPASASGRGAPREPPGVVTQPAIPPPEVLVGSVPAGPDTPGAGGVVAAAEQQPAHLRVGAFPWGRIWIDGRAAGQAPVRRRLAPGRHVVAAGIERPLRRREVVLEPGESRRIMFNIEADADDP